MEKDVPNHTKDERRQYTRYASDLKLAFYVSFDFETRIDFRVKKDQEQSFSRAKYSGTTKNVSAQGLCFITDHELCKKDFLSLEIYLPNKAESLDMEGRVRWSRLLEQNSAESRLFETGVKLTAINGEEVERSLVFDDIHKIYWSNVLETIFAESKHKLFGQV
jgi:hypothetical protein